MMTVLVLTTVYDDRSATTIRSICEAISISLCSMLISIMICDVNGTKYAERLRNGISTSMESMLKSATIRDCIRTMAIEILIFQQSLFGGYTLLSSDRSS